MIWSTKLVRIALRSPPFLVLFATSCHPSNDVLASNHAILGCQDVGFHDVSVVKARIHSSPAITIGDADGDVVFYDVRSVRRLEDRGVVVANSGTGEIKFFDSAGSHRMTVGRRGAGPSEFQNLSDLFVLAGDTLVAFDGYPPSVVILTADGVVHTRSRVPLPGDGVLLERAVGLVDRHLIVIGTSARSRALGPSDKGVDRVPLDVYAASLWGDTIWHIARVAGIELGYERTNGRVRRMSLPVRRATLLATLPRALAVVDNNSKSIQFLSLHGDTLGNVNIPVGGRPMTPSLLEEYISDFLVGLPPLTKKQYTAWRSVVDEIVLDGDAPYLTRLIGGHDGRVWLQFDPPPGFDGVVLATMDGDSVQCMELPVGLAVGPDISVGGDVLDIGSHHVVGVWKDSLGVERVYEWTFPR